MKQYFKVTGLMMLMLFVFTTSAMAYSITYSDSVVAWSGFENPAYPEDSIGVPLISSMTVTIGDDANAYLKSVVINVTYRLQWDALFINNAGANYKWTYYVRDDYANSDWGATLYKVGANFTYIYSDEGRIGHPAGIASGITVINEATPFNTSGLLASVKYDGQQLVYLFNDGISMADGFKIAYSPSCANDVIETPEPSILMLLGFGLLGVAGLRRKK